MIKQPVPILVVDDNPAKRLALKAVLAPLGYSVVEADSGRAALRCVMTQEFAVILLDVRMPSMDGFETAGLIRARRQSEMTPIIFITAFARDEIVPTARYVEGAVDFIFAPVQPDELRAKVSVFAKLFLKARGLAERAREVERSADQLRLLTDVAPIGIFQTDAQHRFLYTNPRWSDITGIAPEEALGCEWDSMVASESRAGQFIESAMDSSGPADLYQRFEIRIPDREPRVILVTSQAIFTNDGHEAGWVGTVADITVETSAEAALSDARDKADEASHLKSDFLANMSHEIRTPMNGVIGMIDLLLETVLDPRQRDYALTVRNSGESLLTILNDILDFSKVEAGKLEIEHVAFDLRTSVVEVIDLLGRSSEARSLALEATVEDSVPHVVLGDSGRLRQVLMNLIGNAIKFTHSGEVGVNVKALEGPGPDTVLRFDVTDTGDGIAPGKLATIFKPFVQADTSTSRKYGGTGLGLAISGQLVSLMGGDCGVTSEVGKGSRFWFTVTVQAESPMVLAETAAEDPTPSVPQLPAADPPEISLSQGDPSASKHVLLAEDNPVNQRVAAAMLENLGFHVDAVANGAEAVKAFAGGGYQLILMDCQMPELDGYQATAKIRRLEGDATRTPIIALTASAMKNDRARCMSAGMDDYLSKPLTLKALGGVLARWTLETSEPAQQAPTTDWAGEGGSDPVILDEEILGRLQRLSEATGGELMDTLVGLFLSEADARVSAIVKAVEKADQNALSFAAHSLRGASANLGASHLADLCANLEFDLGPGELEGDRDLLTPLTAELVRVRTALHILSPTA